MSVAPRRGKALIKTSADGDALKDVRIDSSLLLKLFQIDVEFREHSRVRREQARKRLAQRALHINRDDEVGGGQSRKRRVGRGCTACAAADNEGNGCG